MKWLAALLAFTCFSPFSAFASAGEVWVCNYRDDNGVVQVQEYRTRDHLVTMRDSLVNGGHVVSDFTQLVDNEYAIIGVISRADSDPKTGIISVGFYTVMIDKHLKKFRMIYSPMEGDRDFMSSNLIANGNCIKQFEPHLFHDH